MVDIYARLIGDKRILAFIHNELGEAWCDASEADYEPTSIEEVFEIDYGYFDSRSHLVSFVNMLATYNLNIKVQAELYTSESDLDDAFDWYVLTHDPEADKADITFIAYHAYMPRPSKVVELQNQPEALNTYLKELETARNNLHTWDDENISLSHEHMLNISLNK